MHATCVGRDPGNKMQRIDAASAPEVAVDRARWMSTVTWRLPAYLLNFGWSRRDVRHPAGVSRHQITTPATDRACPTNARQRIQKRLSSKRRYG
jgi:hypothetical protein